MPTDEAYGVVLCWDEKLKTVRFEARLRQSRESIRRTPLQI